MNNATGWFFTFPQRIEELRNRYVLIHTMDFDHARFEVGQALGVTWAFQYPASDVERQIEKFGLSEIPLVEASEIILRNKS